MCPFGYKRSTYTKLDCNFELLIKDYVSTNNVVGNFNQLLKKLDFLIEFILMEYNYINRIYIIEFIFNCVK